jgi:hypothetical protein
VKACSAQNIEALLNEDYPLQCEPGYERKKTKVVCQYNNFLAHLSLTRVAAKSYKVPINNEKARAYFRKCLQAYLRQEEKWDIVTNTFWRMFRTAKRDSTNAGGYAQSLSRLSTEEDVKDLIQFLDHTFRQEEGVPSSATSTSVSPAEAPSSSLSEIPPSKKRKKM